MSTGRRLTPLALLVIVGLFGATAPRAICGMPGQVLSSKFGGNGGYVILYNPAPPYNQVGWALIPLVGGDLQFGIQAYQTVLHAAVASPPKYLSVITNSVNPDCGVCNHNLAVGDCGTAITVVLYP